MFFATPPRSNTLPDCYEMGWGVVLKQLAYFSFIALAVLEKQSFYAHITICHGGNLLQQIKAIPENCRFLDSSRSKMTKQFYFAFLFESQHADSAIKSLAMLHCVKFSVSPQSSLFAHAR